jgi:hypothetical protein
MHPRNNKSKKNRRQDKKKIPDKDETKRREYDKKFKQQRRSEGWTKKEVDMRLTEIEVATAQDLRDVLTRSSPSSTCFSPISPMARPPTTACRQRSSRRHAPCLVTYDVDPLALSMPFEEVCCGYYPDLIHYEGPERM